MADQSNWRQKQRTSQMAATDNVKAVYLCELAEHGRRWHAAEKAGTTQKTILRAMERDTEFADAVEEALGAYADKVKARHQHLVFNDEETVQLGKDGKPTQVNRRAYEKSIHKELEAAIPAEYKPGAEKDVFQGTSGVLVVGKEISLDDFAKREHEANVASKEPTENLDD